MISSASNESKYLNAKQKTKNDRSLKTSDNVYFDDFNSDCISTSLVTYIQPKRKARKIILNNKNDKLFVLL